MPFLPPDRRRVNPSSERAALRKTLRQRRRQLPPGQRIAGAEALADRLLALPDLPATGYVAGYWATDGEIGLHAFQIRLPAGLIYCLPLLHADGTLRFAPWRPGDPLVTNRYGIPEPDVHAEGALMAADMHLLVMPLVGFTAQCQRLGMGGGWYDRTLAFRRERPAPPLLVGVGFDEQQTAPIADAPWDIHPDLICTPTRTLHRCPSA